MSRYAGKKTGKKIADEETAQKIIAALENESIKYETYFKLIIATGMRRGECCALQWRDIDREQLNIHSLRHTAASLIIAGGADMATVAGILGHSQLSATLDIYTHTFDKNKKAASSPTKKQARFACADMLPPRLTVYSFAVSHRGSIYDARLSKFFAVVAK